MDIKSLAKTQIDDLVFCVVDVETTGMNSKYNRVMDIGIVKVKSGEILDEWEALIDPQQEVPFWITHYTKLTDAHVFGKPKFNELAHKINFILNDSIFVGHNAGFDYSFLSNEMHRAGIEFVLPKLCTVMLGRKLLPQLANAHLDAISDFYNISISARHRALPDAQATAEILINFINIAKEKYNAKTYFDLENLQRIKIDKEKLFSNEKDLFSN